MERRLVGKRVWVDVDDERRRGTVLSTDDSSVVIREDGGKGVIVVPSRREGERWGLLEDGNGPKGS
jgi:hypothetical protein